VGAILRASLHGPLNISRLKPGNVVEARLARSLYLGGGLEIAPAGSRVRLVTESIKKDTISTNKVVTFFADLCSLYWRQRPTRRNYTVSFGSASLILGDSSELPMKVSLLRIVQPVKSHPPIEANAASETSADRPKTKPDEGEGQSVMLLRLEQPLLVPVPLAPKERVAFGSMAPGDVSVTLQPGAKAHLLLLNQVKASMNPAGDLLQARLVEPICVGNRIVLPEGSLFEGRVTLSVPPRWMNRAASLRLNFNHLTLPEGTGAQVSASVSGADAAEKSGLRIDSEGTLHAAPINKKQLAMQLSFGYMSGKLADDLADTIIKVTVGGSNATLTRYIGIGTALVYLCAHRGKDVTLPKYSELEVTFDRATSMPLAEGSQALPAAPPPSRTGRSDAN